MLIRLTIQNYALIKHLEMEPSAKLNVITGETGAGKSIMLGAVGLLLGNRADSKALWNESEKCITEGVFDISSYHLEELFANEDLDYEKQTVIRREISPTGKSRAFINDTPVTLETLRKVGSTLMDVHSQHETLELGNRAFQLHLVDTYASHPKLKDDYVKSWKEYSIAKKELDSLLKESDTLRLESEFVQFQLKELTQADLSSNEQETLEAEFKIMEHSEDIKIRFNEAIAIAGGAEVSLQSMLTEIKNKLSVISSYSTSYAALSQRIESMRIELDDVLNEMEHEESKIDFDPVRTENIKDRLSLIYQLLQKHRTRNIDDLLLLQESLQVKADKVSNLDEALSIAKKKLDKATTDLQKRSTELSASRRKTIKPLCAEITVLLNDLGIPDAQLKIELEPTAPGPDGSDSIAILFSANKGIAPRELGQVASGGEFSRVMFCVKYVMAEKTSLPTLILDEIDNGVSGEIAIQLGKMMKSMAKKHQLITITHLPQIAAKGDFHYFVYKDNAAGKTISNIQKLEGDDRIEEIAKMIGGAKPSLLAVENARELLGKF